jgi:hypothetical protein
MPDLGFGDFKNVQTNTQIILCGLVLGHGWGLLQRGSEAATPTRLPQKPSEQIRRGSAQTQITWVRPPHPTPPQPTRRGEEYSHIVTPTLWECSRIVDVLPQ